MRIWERYRGLARAGALGICALACILLANLLAGQLLGNGYSLTIGTRPDRSLVSGFFGAETDQQGTRYRWTSAASLLTLRGPAAASSLLTLDLGWLPPGAAAPRDLQLIVDGAYWTSLPIAGEPRRYALMLPPGSMADGELQLGMRSETTRVPPDKRDVGVRLDAVELSWPGLRWPLPPLGALAAQWGITLCWIGAAHRLRLRTAPTALTLAALIAGMGAMTVAAPTLAWPWQIGLLGASLVGLAIAWGGRQLLDGPAEQASDGFARALLLITLAALAVRMVGLLFPTFISHDYLVNSRRLASVQFGDLTLFDRPSEFSRNVAVVSPTVFLLALPLSLIGDRELALQGLYTVLDSTTPLLVGLLARRLGLSERGSLLAAGLIALLPMHLTALYWGFVKQIVGQWLTLLLLLVAAYPAPRRTFGWVAAGGLAVVTLLIHPGGLLLTGICLGLWVVAGLALELRDERARPGGATSLNELLARPALAPWRGWFLTLAAVTLLLLVIQYADAIRLMLGGLLDGSTATPDSTNQVTDQAARLAQIWIGLRASFDPLPLILVGAGMVALFYKTRGPGRLLAAGWTASAALFLAVDIVTGQQVRYGYFIAPLACVGVAALIEPALKLQAGRLAAWALVALVLVAGTALWLGASFYGIKPSVNPLTH